MKSRDSQGSSPASRKIATVLVAASFLVANAVPALSGTMSLPGNFGVSPAGAATYSIPIALPPGTAGMAPSLALEYNSQGGNGLLGMGWSLSGLPSITRCPSTMVQDGTVGGVNFDANDRFCMDGQRLVAVAGTYGADGAQYRTEVESFSKIISHGAAGNGPAWFEVRTKSGQTMEFGSTADSRILAQGKTSARVWAVNKVSDTKANYFTATYTNDATNGEFYPARIDYTGNAAASVSPYNSVQFVYGGRSDIASAYLAGSVSKATVRLADIKTYIGAALVTDYQLAYQQNALTGRSDLSSVKACSADNNCLPATTFAWPTSTINFPSSFATTNWAGFTVVMGDWAGTGRTGLLFQAPYAGSTTFMFTADEQGNLSGTGFGPTTWAGYDIYPGDWDGDGKTDLLLMARVSGSTSFVMRSTGTSFVSTGFSPTTWGNYKVAVGDWNGDGRSDLFLYYTGPGSDQAAGFMYLSNGDGTFSGTGYNPIGWGSYDIYTGDWDGDGKTDLVLMARISGNASFVVRSTGTSFVSTGFSPTTWGNYKVTVGDWNGDGRSDVFLYYTGSGAGQAAGFMYLSNGDGTFSNTGYNPIGWGTYTVYVGDWDADGKSDLALVAKVSGGTSFLVRSTGAAFVSTSFNPTTWGGGYYLVPSADFNGDGASDLLLFAPAAGSNSFIFYSGLVPELMSSITNGLGATTSITYQPLTRSAVYQKDANATYPQMDVQASIRVVSRVDVSNGIGGTYSSSYGYVGAKADLSGRGFLGFRQTTVKDLQTGIADTTSYRQDFPHVGLVASTARTLGTQTLGQSSNAYQFSNSGGASVISAPSVGSAPYKVSLSQNVSGGADLDGSALPTVTTSNQYDAYLNATQVVVSTPDGFSKTTTNTYSNDPSLWYLGRLTRATVSNVAP